MTEIIRVITLAQWQQVRAIAYAARLTPKQFHRLTATRMALLLQNLEVWDKQVNEYLEFEVDAVKPMDQRLMGSWYFAALRDIKILAREIEAERAFDALLG